MSRIGKKPLPVPANVKVGIADRTVTVEGPLGKLEFAFRPEIGVNFDDQQRLVVVTRANDQRQSRALHGLTRSLIKNMIEGVTKGYERKLEVVGVGYIAAVQKATLQLRVGLANELQVPRPAARADQGHRQATSDPFRRFRPRPAEARAVQGERHPLRRRGGSSQAGQGHSEVSRNRAVNGTQS
jgi:large subunit ribosomal protein L6